jgi:hypothetical protein
MAAQQQVLGRGKIYFERFATNAKIGNGAERYLGNTPSFSTSRSDENLDHFDSDEGLKQKDIVVTLQSTQTGTVQFDSISKENIALLFSGDASVVTQTATGTTPVSETRKLTPGTSLQIGLDATHPLGVRGLSEVTVKTTGGTPTTVSATGNFVVHLDTGRIDVVDAPAETTIDGMTDFTIEYKLAAGTFDQVISAGQQVYGALRFVSANAYGPQRDYYFPYVKLTPNGDFSLKGDDWQKGEFALEILKRDDTTERVYVAGRLTT